MKVLWGGADLSPISASFIQQSSLIWCHHRSEHQTTKTLNLHMLGSAGGGTGLQRHHWLVGEPQQLQL